MAGEAKTSAFMLGTATVMIGAMEDLFDLNPDDHSIGLVKNFRVSSEPAYTDLTQGIRNQIVYSVMTGNPVQASMEVYEYTGSNLTYSLGLEGAGVAAQTAHTTVETLSVAGDSTLAVVDESGFNVGDYILIQHGEGDQVFVRQVSAAAAKSLEFDVPLAKAIPAGAKISVANAIDIGSVDEQPFLAAKIVGILADGTETVLLCPKIRISNGFSLGFTTEGFDNLPYEFSFFDQVADDPFYSEFRGKQAKLLTRK